jgi:hypothetical protein
MAEKDFKVKKGLIVGDLTSTGYVKVSTVGSALTTSSTISTSDLSGVVSAANGGTGINNGSSTITLGGNLSTSGAATLGSSTHTLSLVTTGNTSVTLPTTGTLATLSGSESLTNKKLGSLTSNGIVTTSGGDGTLSVTATTGSGDVVLATSPTLVTPTLGAATATSINGLAITSSTGTLTIANGKTATVSNTLTFTGTDSSSVAFGGGGTVAYTGDKLNAFAATSSSELAGVISDETGSGALVFGTSPTFTTGIDGGATFAAFASSTDLTIGYSGINSSTTNISVAATNDGQTKTVNIGTNGDNGSTTIINIGTDTDTGSVSNVNIGSTSGGTVTIKKDLTVTGDLIVNGSTTTINSTTLSVDDKNIELASTASPSDASADGAGITVKGTTDKTFNWVDSTDAWTSSEHMNLASGKAYYINGTSVLNGTTLGSGVTSSSLTSVGTIATGTWQGTAVAVAYGGTGATDAATARTNLGLAIGTDVQAYNSTLAAVAGGTYTGDDSIATVGTITAGTWNGSTIAVANGGTGATTATGAINNLLPSQGSAANKYLKSDGTNVSWATIPSGGAGDLTGDTLASNVLNSSLTSVGTLTGLNINGVITLKSSGTDAAKTSATAYTLSAATATAVDSVAASGVEAVEYTVSLMQGTSTNMRMRTSKILAQHNSGTGVVDYVEYGIIETGSALMAGVSVEAALNNSNIELQVTVTDANTNNVTCRVVRTVLL